ncbi:MAG: T9SS type A sorting domain-containing protein [Chitinophagales bacterium]|nr:T9SS type A sorting domain-containing protein [Chitinophagales bacterium]MDW8394272.1 T9SS type A sorting domain-containing protein [Chitinophagales bacterium]
MKKFVLLIFSLLAFRIMAWAQIPDSVVMEAGYTHQVYYQLSDGSRTPVALASWDIGFQTSLMTASIMINESSVALYYAAGADTSQYATLDVSNYTSWPRYYNSEQSWNIGAFNQLANPGNQFDFGWGVYDFTQHTVFGTRLFVVESGGQAYKFWIRKKTSTGDYVIRYTPIATGAADVNITLSASAYSTKNFVYLKLATSSVVDPEPASCCWQMLFTRYASNIPGLGYYMVTGVYIAPGVKAVKAYPVDVETDSFQLHQSGFSTKLTTIGYDWKYFDPVTMMYVLEDSLLYYVQDATGKKIWRLQFTGFDHLKGLIKFTRQLVYDATVGMESAGPALLDFRIVPNPTSGNLSLTLGVPVAGSFTVSVRDLSGKPFLTRQLMAHEGLNVVGMSVSEIPAGIYIVEVNNDQFSRQMPVVVVR